MFDEPISRAATSRRSTPRWATPAAWRSSITCWWPTRLPANCSRCCRCRRTWSRITCASSKTPASSRARRSEADRRRTYLRLNHDALEAMVPTDGPTRPPGDLRVHAELRAQPARGGHLEPPQPDTGDLGRHPSGRRSPSRCRGRRAPPRPADAAPHSRNTLTNVLADDDLSSRCATTSTRNCPRACAASTGRSPTRSHRHHRHVRSNTRRIDHAHRTFRSLRAVRLGPEGNT